VLYFWTALIFHIFGDSDFTSRLSPGLFGSARSASAGSFDVRALGAGALLVITLSPS
jgi:predicted membrane-bound mannosyltransferase